MITEEAIIDLLPHFEQCKDYADRLAFWQKHDLTEKLHYDIPFRFEFWYPAEEPTAKHPMRLSLFTIAPFNEDEAQQFIDWALRVRPVMPNAPLSAQKLCLDFQNRYYSIGRKADREEYLKECQQKTDRLIKESRLMNAIQEGTVLGDALTRALCTHFFARLKRGFEPNLIDHIRIGEVELDWQVIDTYLHTDALYNYAVFLERFNPEECKTVESDRRIVQTQQASVNLTHSQIALLHHYNGQAINKNNADTIAAKYGHTSGKRLEKTYKDLISELNRTATGKYTVKNIVTVISLLSGTGLALAEKELGEAIKNNKNSELVRTSSTT